MKNETSISVIQLSNKEDHQSQTSNHSIITHELKRTPGSEMDALDLPASFCFCPRDHELIVDYLLNKNSGLQPPLDIIKEYEVYKCNPEQLPRDFKYAKQNEMYFFTKRDRKYQNGSRPDRSAGDGYWKATNADQAIHDGKEVVGYKLRLVFYKGKNPKGKKTNWAMHEYRANKKDFPPASVGEVQNLKMDGFVLCRVYELRQRSKDTPTPSAENGPPGMPIVGQPATNLSCSHDNAIVIKVEDSGNKDSHLQGLLSDPPKDSPSTPVNALSQITSANYTRITTGPSKEKEKTESSTSEQDASKVKKRKREAAPSPSTPPEKRCRSSNGQVLVGEVSRTEATLYDPKASTPPPIANDPCSYAACLEQLQRLEGLDDIDIVQAVDVLKDHQNAVAFMTLRGTLRLNWLRLKCRGR